MQEVLSLAVEPVDPQPAAPRTLITGVWRDVIGPFIADHLRGTAYEWIIEAYLDVEASEGYSERWLATDREIGFDFRDAAGLMCMSATAAEHWTQLALAARSHEIASVVEHHGYRVVMPTAPSTPVPNESRYPLLLVRGVPHCVSCREFDLDNPTMAALWSDDDRTVDFHLLSQAEQATVRAVSRTGACECPLCAAPDA